VAGAALLIDYVLTVAVSVSSGVGAMASVWPAELGPVRVELSVAFVVLLAWGNLRAIRGDGGDHGDAVPGHHLPGGAAPGAAVRQRLPDRDLPDRRQVLGSGPAFLLVQTATLLILVLAATTAFSGFPLLVWLLLRVQRTYGRELARPSPATRSWC
jgi:hypothetical protein